MTYTGLLDLANEIKVLGILNSDDANDDVVPNDDKWIKNAFMVDAMDLSIEDAYGSIYDIDTFKFTDTSLGGSISLNVYPQFTRYTDIRMPSRIMKRNEVTVTNMSGNFGMGHYYSEAIDDNSFNVYFEFGVPNFNNILFYFLSATDYKKAVIANEGRSPIFYDLGELSGTIALVIAFPYITIPLIIIKKVALTLGDLGVFPGRFDYYYLKPTMFNYWATVNSIVTMMATELGIASSWFMPKSDVNDNDKVGIPLEINQEEIDAFKKLMPDIITSGNVINVHGMVAKAQKRLIELRRKQLKTLENLSKSFTVDPENVSEEVLNNLDVTDVKVNDLWQELKNKTSKMSDLYGKEKDTNKKEKNTKANNEQPNQDQVDKLLKDDKIKLERKLRKEDQTSWLSDAIDVFQSVFNEGARYAIFRVEFLGSATESFSNTTTTVDTIDAINEMGKTWRKMKYNIAAGEVPILGDVIKGVTDFISGQLSGITLGLSNVVGSFLSGMTLEAPMRWDDSTFNLPSLNFRMRLISHSAHPIAQLRGIYIPLAAILAAALPRSTGPKSYTSPFALSMYLRGYQRVTLGMITSLSITRGVSNLPYNKYMRPLAIDVNFTVTDFSQVIASPTPSNLLSSGDIAYDDEAGINRYIAALCGRDLFSATHIGSRFKIKASNFLKSMALAASPQTIGAAVGDAFGSSFLFSMFGENTVKAAYNDTLGNDAEFNRLLNRGK